MLMVITHESLWKLCRPMAARTGAGLLNPLDEVMTGDAMLGGSGRRAG
jgi:hypothetical protein